MLFRLKTKVFPQYLSVAPPIFKKKIFKKIFLGAHRHAAFGVIVFLVIFVKNGRLLMYISDMFDIS